MLFVQVMLAGQSNVYAFTQDTEDLSLEEADQLIKQVFASLDFERYEAAIEAYYHILQHIQPSLEEEDVRIVSRHIRALALILDDAELASMGIDISLEGVSFFNGFAPDISEQLIRWWRLQDTVPATPINDRLAEHLQRVVIAWTEYEFASDPRGFDDRGEIYVRLGEPSTKSTIRLLSSDLQMNVGGFRMPPNEFWVYDHVAYDAHYIFARLKTRAGYQISNPMDLVPQRLQASRRKIGELLLWMEEVYGQLALMHNIYGALYDEVANYRVLPGRDGAREDVFARGVIHKASTEDLQLIYQRSQNVPTIYSSRFGSAAQLSLPFRWARFLEEDGKTRMEIYWSLDNNALKPSRRFVRQMYREGHVPSKNYLVSVYSGMRDINLMLLEGVEKHYLTDANTLDPLPVRSLSLIGEEPLFNLTLHWEQRWTITEKNEEESMLPGVLVKFKSHVMDSVQALHADGEVLEVSDLKVLRYEEGALLEDASPYPYPTLTDSTQIALYFEVYNLAYSADDRTAYTVSYEVNTPKEKAREATQVSTSYEGDSRTTQEYIIPDLSREDVSRGVEIVLTIKDDLTGEQRRRVVQFQSP